MYSLSTSQVKTIIKNHSFFSSIGIHLNAPKSYKTGKFSQTYENYVEGQQLRMMPANFLGGLVYTYREKKNLFRSCIRSRLFYWREFFLEKPNVKCQ